MSLEFLIAIIGIVASIITFVQFFLGYTSMKDLPVNSGLSGLVKTIIHHLAKQLWNAMWTLLIIVALLYLYNSYTQWNKPNIKQAYQVKGFTSSLTYREEKKALQFG